jgi:hypothetical protein
MRLQTTLNKLSKVTSHADEFIAANAQLLPKRRSKLIDLATVSLMQFEDHLFHWDQLRNIVIERVGMFEHGKIPWFIDIDRSSSTVLTITHDRGQHIKMDVGQILLSTLISVY